MHQGVNPVTSLEEAARQKWIDAQRIVGASPARGEAWGQYALQWIQNDDWGLARLALDQQLLYSPNDVSAWLRSALLWSHMGNSDEAEAAYREVLERDPHQIIALNNLGTLLMQAYRYSEAVTYFKRAWTRNPEDTQVLFNLAHGYSRDGDMEQAQRVYGELSLRCTENPRVEWGRLYASPVVYRTEQEIEDVRSRWLTTLGELDGMITRSSEPVAWVSGLLSAFYMHYSCAFDREIQGAYGGVVHRLMCRAAPESSRPLYRKNTAGRRIRVGVVSTYLRKHTVSKLFQGWFKQIDPKRFALYGYQLSEQCDGVTDQLNEVFTSFEACDLTDWLTVAQRIKDADLDVIIYPEVGMDADTLKMAALRLAPLQCMAWGHPVTSGLPTIDVFLSSELMEPVDGASHYFERVVRLPGLGICYDRPQTPPKGDILKRLGLAEGTLYLCCQSLNKYLPRHDWVWPEIAAQVPDAQFVFLKLPGAESTRRFEARLAVAFASKGIDWTDHCTILPRLSERNYLRLNGAADVYLDSLSWSGGNTSLEALAYDLPVVACTGRTMRERHTAAMLNLLELDEWVAESPEQFVALAVQLGQSPALRERVRQHVRTRSPRLFGTKDAVRALEQFMEREVGVGAPQRLRISGGH